MNLLPLESWNIILSLLESNYDKFHLLTTFKGMFKCPVSFNELVDFNKITHSQWFNDFNRIKLRGFCGPYPKNVRYIEVNANGALENENWFISNTIHMNHFEFPEGITQLSFNCIFYDIPHTENSLIKYWCEFVNIHCDENVFVIDWRLSTKNQSIYEYLPKSLQCITFCSTIIDLQRNIKHVNFVKESSGIFINDTPCRLTHKDLLITRDLSRGTYRIKGSSPLISIIWDYKSGNTIAIKN